MDASAFLKGDPSAGRQTPSLQLSRFIGFTPGPRPESARPKQTQSDSASQHWFIHVCAQCFHFCLEKQMQFVRLLDRLFLST